MDNAGPGGGSSGTTTGRYDGLMLSTLAPLLVASESALPAPPIFYGLTALAFFAMMLGVLFAFRQAASKVPTKDNTVAHDSHDSHGHDAGGHH